MPAARHHHLRVRRGSSFSLPVRWETEPWRYAQITQISQSAPVRIEASHSIPDGWRVAVIGARGMTELNAQHNPPRDSDMRRATVEDSTGIEFNDLSSVDWREHKAGTGYLAWLTPKPLTGYSARMSIKTERGALVAHLDSAPDGGIEIDPTHFVITVSLTAEQTATFPLQTLLYDLELVSSTGEVTALLAGRVDVCDEITTPIP